MKEAFHTIDHLLPTLPPLVTTTTHRKISSFEPTRDRLWSWELEFRACSVFSLIGFSHWYWLDFGIFVEELHMVLKSGDRGTISAYENHTIAIPITWSVHVRKLDLDYKPRFEVIVPNECPDLLKHVSRACRWELVAGTASGSPTSLRPSPHPHAPEMLL